MGRAHAPPKRNESNSVLGMQEKSVSALPRLTQNETVSPWLIRQVLRLGRINGGVVGSKLGVGIRVCVMTVGFNEGTIERKEGICVGTSDGNCVWSVLVGF